MSTWIERFEASVAAGEGLRVAVKDAIDVAECVTTAGCPAVAEWAEPAPHDAACVATARQAGARLVGKTNLHELCFGTSGTNPWFGSPVNPLDPTLVPGGSSSGSAVAVATDQADVALGTDTGGSVRIPAAACGVVGLKTTYGRISTAGVWPLAPSLDTVGPLAATVAGVVEGMMLLDRSFRPGLGGPAALVGRVRPPVEIDPAVDQAIDRALQQGGLEVVEVDLGGWPEASAAFLAILCYEAWMSDGYLTETDGERVGDQVRERLLRSREVTDAQYQGARQTMLQWREAVRHQFDHVQVLALPTLVSRPPELGSIGVPNSLVSPWNLSGNPAIALPVPASGWHIPTSLQLVGPWGGEEILCATAAVVEGAVT